MVTYPTGFNTVSIANMALSCIGARSKIVAMQENSPEANQCNMWYDFSRLQTLEAFNWSFARKRAALVESSIDPPEGIWAYRYDLPTDCIKIRELENPFGPDQDAIPFEIETDDNGVSTLLTNLDGAKAIYTKDVTDVSLFPPLYILALSQYLGHRIAFSITGDTGIEGKAWNQFLFTIRQASTADATQSVSQAPRDGEGIRARQ